MIIDLTGKRHLLCVYRRSPGCYHARLGESTATEERLGDVTRAIVSSLDANHPEQFDRQPLEKQEALLAWIRANLRPGTPNKSPRYSSYYLKHLAERSLPGGYVGNGEMKGALLKAGYTPSHRLEVTSLEYAINWDFVLERGLPEALDQPR